MLTRCALCLIDAELRNSHVIPEFIYKSIYDDKHRFHELEISNASQPRFRQKGHRERLLCAACESHISTYERYTSLVFSGAIATRSSRSGNLVTVTGIDYKKLKLFAYSIVWKASVSRLPLFAEVQLGKHEEYFRLALLNDNPGRAHNYAVIINGLSVDDEPFFGLMVEPTKSKLDGHICYRFVFGSMIWVFIVSSHALSTTVKQAVLNENGSFWMLLSDLRDIPFLARQLEQLQQHWRNEHAT